MGINKSAVKVFLDEGKKNSLNGKLLTLGRQDVFVNTQQLNQILSDYGISHLSISSKNLSHKLELAKSGFISDEALFKKIGFSEVYSLDASEYENATYIHDLNQVPPDPSLVENFDCIFDGGTLEHIFNVPNALENIFRMLKVGGRIIHIAPSSNHIDHGFYMFSPTFFWDYYNANSYKLSVCEVFRYTTNLYDGDWLVSDYIPGGLHRVSMGGLDDALYGVILVATKTNNSTYDVVPQQGMYSDDLWIGNSASGITSRVEDILDTNFNGKGLGLKIKKRL